MPICAVATILSNSASRSSSVRTFEFGEPLRHALHVEHDGGRDDRPGERPTPDLVDAGDGAVPAAHELALAREVRAQMRGKANRVHAGRDRVLGRSLRG